MCESGFSRILTITIVIVLTAAIFAFADDGAGKSGYISLGGGGANKIEPFSGGAPINSDVNLYTGDVQFGLGLVNLPGPEGFNLDISMAYSSNIEHLVRADNDVSQASWVGLGWTLEFPAIVADLKNTADYSDDEYWYIDPSAGKNKLLALPTENEYVLENYKFWKITRIIGDDKITEEGPVIHTVVGWKIQIEDGIEYYFGDLEFFSYSRSWIPNASRLYIAKNKTIVDLYAEDALGEPLRYIAYQWDLRQIKDIRNDNVITLEYDHQRKCGYIYGSRPYYYTTWSHPKKIISPLDHEVHFYTEERLDIEKLVKMDKANFIHYDNLYLDSIVIFGCYGEKKIGKYNFSYIVTGKVPEYTFDHKRYLIEINYLTPNELKSPSIKFGYFHNHGTDIHYGALESVIYPSGSLVTYSYNQEELLYDSTKAAGWQNSGYFSVGNGIAARTEALGGGNFDLIIFNWDGHWEVDTVASADPSVKEQCGQVGDFGGIAYLENASQTHAIKILERVSDRWQEYEANDSFYIHWGKFFACGIDAFLYLNWKGYFWDIYCLKRNKKNTDSNRWEISLIYPDYFIKDNNNWGEKLHVGIGRDYFVIYNKDSKKINVIKWRQDLWEWNASELDGEYQHLWNNSLRCADNYFVVGHKNRDHQPMDYYVNAYLWDNNVWEEWSGPTFHSTDYNALINLSVQDEFFAYSVDHENGNMVDAYRVIPLGGGSRDYQISDRIIIYVDGTQERRMALCTGPDFIAYSCQANEGVRVVEWDGTDWIEASIDDHNWGTQEVELRSGGNYFLAYLKDDHQMKIFYESNDISIGWRMQDAFGDTFWGSDLEKLIYSFNNNSCGVWDIDNGNVYFTYFNNGYEGFLPSEPYFDKGINHIQLITRNISCPTSPYREFVTTNLLTYYGTCETLQDTLRSNYYHNPYTAQPYDVVYDYPVSHRRIREINDPTVLDKTWMYYYQYGNTDKSGFTTKYNKVREWNNSLPNSGFVEHYFYNDLSEEDNDYVQGEDPNFPDLEADHLGNGHMLDGLEYKTIFYDGNLQKMDSVVNYYYCEDGTHLDLPGNVAGLVSLVRLDSTYQCMDDVKTLTAFQYNDNTGFIERTEFCYNLEETDPPENSIWHFKKIEDTFYAADEIQAMNDKNMLSQISRKDIRFQKYGQPEELLRSSKNAWEAVNINGAVRYLITADSILNDGIYEKVSNVDYFNFQAGVLQGRGALGVPYVNWPDLVGSSTIASFENASLTEVFFDDFGWDYCGGAGPGGGGGNWGVIGGILYGSDGCGYYYGGSPKYHYEYDWGAYPDYPDYGTMIAGRNGDGIRANLYDVWSGLSGGDEPPENCFREGIFVLRCEILIPVDTHVRIRVGNEGLNEFPIDWISDENYEDGRWHTIFVEGEWTQEVGCEVDILITLGGGGPLACWLDNIAFFPKNSLTTSKRYNFNIGLTLASYDDNGYATRYKYGNFYELVASTDITREYRNAFANYQAREMEIDENFTDFKKYPNFNSKTAYPKNNLILNGNFEHETIGWINSNDAIEDDFFKTVLYNDHREGQCEECENPLIGAKALRVNTNVDFNEVRLIQKAPIGIINTDKGYHVSFIAWANFDSGAGSTNPFIEIWWFDACGWFIESATTILFDDLVNTINTTPTIYEDWTEMIIPEEARSCYFIIVIDGTDLYSQDVYYFDAIEMYEYDQFQEPHTPAVKSITYYDGLGNTLQGISTTVELNSPDFISSVKYDNNFRPIKKYKVYEITQTGVGGEPYPHQYDFEFVNHCNNYYDGNPGPDCGTYPYTETIYMEDSRGRIEEIYHPGLEFRDPDLTIKYGYGTNDAEIPANSIDNYMISTLFKSIVINEDGIKSVTFKNPLGQVIETVIDSSSDPGSLNLTTRYETNAVGENLRVIPPKGEDYAIVNTYDDLGRVTTATSPDAGMAKYVYDKLGRVRFSQNAKQRNYVIERWTETRYDVLGRKTCVGEIQSEIEPSPDQNILDSMAVGQVIHRYYYDELDHPIPHPEWEYDPDKVRVRGKLVASDNGQSPPDNGGVEKYFMYNEYGDLMAVETEIDGLSTKVLHLLYDKSGKLVKEYYPDNDYSVEHTLQIGYEYDELGRLINISDIGNDIQLAHYDYLADGSIIEYEIGEYEVGGHMVPVQNVDYRYNPRGWLTHINGFDDGDLDPDDLFGEKIGYINESDPYDNEICNFDPECYARYLYNGTPKWFAYRDLSGFGPDSTGYSLVYDNAYRLTSAKYGEKSGISWTLDGKKEMQEFIYDVNSNIESQTRWGGGPEYDTYDYIYYDNTNKLKYLDGYHHSMQNYLYDETGNVIYDEGHPETDPKQASYEYDWRNVMTYAEWTPGDTTPALYFKYDPSGKRVKKHYYAKEFCRQDKLCETQPPPYWSECENEDCTWTPGDANGDGSCDGLDVSYLRNYFTSGGPEPVLFYAADANCSGGVNGLDLTYIVNYLKGGPQPICCFWQCLDNFTYYIYSKGNVAVEYYKGADTTHTLSYVYGPTGIVAAYYDTTGPFFYLTDHLGSTRMVVDSDANVLADFFYLPSGDNPNEIDWVENVETPVKYTGKELDDEGRFGLYYFGARYYDPFICRWMAPDPAGQFASPYSYGGGAIMVGVDKDGNFFLAPIIVPAVIGALQGGGMYLATSWGNTNFNDFVKSMGMGALGGAVGGGLSLLQGSLAQNFAMETMNSIVSNSAVTLASGGNISESSLISSFIGAGLSQTIPFYTGVKGSDFKNIALELTTNTLRGAYIGGASGLVSAGLTGQDPLKGLKSGLLSGAKGAFVSTAFTISMLGPARPMTEDEMNWFNSMEKDFSKVGLGMGNYSIIMRKGGGLYTNYLKKNYSGVFTGRNIWSADVMDKSIFVHEMIHMRQWFKAGVGRMNYWGFLNMISSNNPYTTVGNFEWAAWQLQDKW